ncbi:hypothetical protein E5345_01300 [Propionibacterium sp. NM47_B9-13]|nr:hypothetical protein BCB70_09040 [Cutibacterium modestum]EFS73723.1 hypothetical protein HMPREF9621_01817 [Cutibacterium modestum HL037PA2]EFT14590.1 hypothetical protein HMPREF9622_02346 [Cutibacterium modestum HL037PA3]TGY29951.1 hypothetical protein E5345_01300 [Propionibacterium sp. NM47_B9-13]
MNSDVTNERPEGMTQRSSISSPLRRVVVMLCAMTAFVLSGCGAVVTTSLTVKDDGSGSRVMTATFTNDDSDEAKKVFAVGSGVLEGSIKRHIPSQLAFKGLKISGKTMTATFELDFSNHDDYMAKVRALTAGSSKEVHSDVQKIDTPLVQGAVGDEDFDSSDLLAWLADGLAQDGLIDKDNTNSVFDNDGNVEFSIGGAEAQFSFTAEGRAGRR